MSPMLRKKVQSRIGKPLSIRNMDCYGWHWKCKRCIKSFRHKKKLWDSSSASPKIFGEILVGPKIFDFRRITLFFLEKRFSKHKMTIYSKNSGGIAPLFPPGYAYALRWYASSGMTNAIKMRLALLRSWRHSPKLQTQWSFSTVKQME